MMQNLPDIDPAGAELPVEKRAVRLPPTAPTPFLQPNVALLIVSVAVLL
jgi:hypothetical protein